jgi:hypothetical protein
MPRSCTPSRRVLAARRAAADRWRRLALADARLDALAAHYGVDAIDVVRMLAKRDADALGIVVEAPTGSVTK